MPQYLISMITSSSLLATGSGKSSWYCSTSTGPCSKNATAFIIIYYYLAIRLCIVFRSCSNCSSSGGTEMSIGSLSESGFPVSFEIVSFFLFHTIELKSIICLVYFVISASSSSSSSSSPSSILNIACLWMVVVSCEYIFVQSSSTINGITGAINDRIVEKHLCNV